VNDDRDEVDDDRDEVVEDDDLLLHLIIQNLKKRKQN
jgi:hypothetical protein